MFVIHKIYSRESPRRSKAAQSCTPERSSHTHTHAQAAWLHHFASNFCAPCQQSPCVCLLSARDPTPSIDRETEWRMKRERLLYEGVQLKINAHKTASMSRGGDKAPVTGSYLAVHWASGKKGKKPEGWREEMGALCKLTFLFCFILLFFSFWWVPDNRSGR